MGLACPHLLKGRLGSAAVFPAVSLPAVLTLLFPDRKWLLSALLTSPLLEAVCATLCLVLRADPAAAAGSAPRGGVGRNGVAVSAPVLRGHPISWRQNHEVTLNSIVGLHCPPTH